jgi:hypothetical protein
MLRLMVSCASKVRSGRLPEALQQAVASTQIRRTVLHERPCFWRVRLLLRKRTVWCKLRGMDVGEIEPYRLFYIMT